MKKIFALVLSLFVLGGCSLFADYYNADQLANEMEQLINQENKNSEDHLVKMDEKFSQYFDVVEKNPAQAKKLLSEISALAGPYKEKVKKVEAKFPDLKAKAQKLEDEEIKKLADAFTADFAKTTKTELQLTDLYLEYVKLQEEILKATESGKQPSEELFKKDQELRNKLDETQKRYDTEIDTFNKSWNVFNQKATGVKVEGQ
jgi:predicted ABC-class ATPase